MRSFNSIKRLICGSAITAAILLTAGGEAFAQKGHGKGRGNGGDNGHGRGQQQRGGGESRRQQKTDNWGGRRQQQMSDRNSRRQQQASDQNSRRQQQMSDRNSRRQQQVSDWNSRRQQQASDRNSRRQQQTSVWNSRRQQQQNNRSGWQQVWTDRRVRSRGNDNDNRRGRPEQRRQRQVHFSPVQIIPGFAWNRRGWSGFRDDKRYRRGMKQARNDERRYQKEQRRYARYNRRSNNYYLGNGNYYANNYYYDDDRGYDNGSGWKQQLLRVVIGSVLGGDFDRGDRYDVSRGYRPIYNSSYGYGVYQPRPAYYNSLLYTGYDDQAYDLGYEDQYYGDDPGLGGLFNELPIADLIGQFTGGNDFVSELLGNFLAQGYDQGFVAGQYARKHRDDDEYYYDPYTYQGGVCDPYSASLGQNRQLLSEGYALGYQDALSGSRDYDPMSDGNVDLVTMLLNSTLSRV